MRPSLKSGTKSVPIEVCRAKKESMLKKREIPFLALLKD